MEQSTNKEEIIGDVEKMPKLMEKILHEQVGRYITQAISELQALDYMLSSDPEGLQKALNLSKKDNLPFFQDRALYDVMTAMRKMIEESEEEKIDG